MLLIPLLPGRSPRLVNVAAEAGDGASVMTAIAAAAVQARTDTIR
jgi:hypothetical protein